MHWTTEIVVLVAQPAKILHDGSSEIGMKKQLSAYIYMTSDGSGEKENNKQEELRMHLDNKQSELNLKSNKQ